MRLNELFYQNPYTKEFTSTVISCEKGKKGYEIELSETAFYPEGGGQPADHGTLQELTVWDVKEREGRILHYVDSPLAVGTEVKGMIDWQRRFSFMQNHSGEHIFSGLVHALFGYDNVGFHMDTSVTVDFNGTMTYEDALLVEKKANELIYQNVETNIRFPSKEELKDLSYRSKIEIDSPVRIVEFPGGDICACCGTHVKRTGEIGLIKVLSLMNHKGGVRIELLCGDWALSYVDKVHDLNKEIAVLYSAKSFETVDAVKRSEKEKEEWKEKTKTILHHYFEERAKGISDVQKPFLLIEEWMSARDLRSFAEYLVEKKGASLCFLLSKKEKNLWNYAIGAKELDLKMPLKDWNQKLNGKGGGKNPVVQGTFATSLEEIQKLVDEIRL